MRESLTSLIDSLILENIILAWQQKELVGMSAKEFFYLWAEATLSHRWEGGEADLVSFGDLYIEAGDYSMVLYTDIHDRGDMEVRTRIFSSGPPMELWVDLRDVSSCWHKAHASDYILWHQSMEIIDAQPMTKEVSALFHKIMDIQKERACYYDAYYCRAIVERNWEGILKWMKGVLS